MGIVRLGEVMEQLRKLSGMQTVEGVPQKLNDSIQPVLVANPKPIINVVLKKTISGTFYTTPKKKDFYLTNVLITSSSKNQNSNVADYCQVYLSNGEQVTINSCHLGSNISETNSNSSEMNFGTHPIKLKRNSPISFVEGSTNGQVIVCGYTVEAE